MKVSPLCKTFLQYHREWWKKKSRLVFLITFLNIQVVQNPNKIYWQEHIGSSCNFLSESYRILARLLNIYMITVKSNPKKVLSKLNSSYTFSLTIPSKGSLSNSMKIPWKHSTANNSTEIALHVFRELFSEGLEMCRWI